MNNKLLRIHTNELRIGMCVCRLEILDGKSPFIFDRLDIKTQADIQTIQEICDYVDIDASWQKKYTGSIPTKTTYSLEKLSFARAFKQTETTFQETSTLIRNVMEDVRFGNQLNMDAIRDVVSKCVDTVVENSSVMSLLTQLKNKDLYTSQHSLNVCILAILVGIELGYPTEKLNNLGLCGLMHDIGKARIALDILNKPGKLEENEMEIMRKHTTFGRNILISSKDMYPGAVDVAFTHHEHIDGSGYPKGVKDGGLSDFTKIISVVDTYDAITSDRCYQKGRPHLIALGILVKSMNIQLDSRFVNIFINCIGFYPQGNLAEMTNGEIGIIVEQNKKNKLKPRILIIKDKNIVRPQDYEVDIANYIKKGVFTKSHPAA